VAEAYDALQRDYPYRQRRSAEEALLEIQQKAGKQFDPEVVLSLSQHLVNVQKMASVPQSVG
jgi:HD-GYP domain-containing protein (c-di-GMP phosphodiesterase class II)